jgi:serine/threonine protein kinase
VLTPPTGYPPFCSENAHDVYRKIIDWRNHLYFPDDVHLSREAEDLIRRMLCEADRRLTCEQLKSHPVSRRGATRRGFVSSLSDRTSAHHTWFLLDATSVDPGSGVECWLGTGWNTR